MSKTCLNIGATGRTLIRFDAFLITLSCVGFLGERHLAAQDPPFDFEATCESLNSLNSDDVDITRNHVATGSGVRHCLVQGKLEGNIGFQVRLPELDRWNNKLVMYGNGGYGGFLAASQEGLIKGYVDVTTDTGHGNLSTNGFNGINARWADNTNDPELREKQIRDYGYRAVHETAVFAKQIVEAFYGKEAAQAYFTGCSGGGNQALMEIQRYPEDFDGVVVGAPNISWSRTAANFAWIQQAQFPNGYVFRENTPPVLSTSKLGLLNREIMNRFDGLDGVEDRLIRNPFDPQFDPQLDLPRCEPGEAGQTCFTDAEIQVVDRLYTGAPEPVAGLRPLGFPVGHEAGWAEWTTSSDFARSFGYPNAGYAMGVQYLRYFAMQDPTIDFADVDLASLSRELATYSDILDADDPNLGDYADRGKVILWHGLADPALSANESLRYYQQVIEKTGSAAETADFFRTFPIPGMYHCESGPGPNSVDWLNLLDLWFREGQAPEDVVATAGRRSQLLCHFPETAVYDGQGDPRSATSFRCEVASGDFSGDGLLDVADINSLQQAVWMGANPREFDVTPDGIVDQFDLRFWVVDLAKTYFGDANLDGQFSSEDLVTVLAAGEYEDDIGGNSTWSTGDWNADGEFTSADLVAALQDGGYEQGPRVAVATVPEPLSATLCIAGLLTSCCRFRYRHRQPISTANVEAKETLVL